jgi:mannose-6-phosphate isomerase-like protein (cupin superfamily)
MSLLATTGFNVFHVVVRHLDAFFNRESTDHYFVLQGALTIETRRPDDRRVITVGERYKILPGTAHCVSNESASECQFLLVQGVGKHDWHAADVGK